MVSVQQPNDLRSAGVPARGLEDPAADRWLAKALAMVRQRLDSRAPGSEDGLAVQGRLGSLAQEIETAVTLLHVRALELVREELVRQIDDAVNSAREHAIHAGRAAAQRQPPATNAGGRTAAAPANGAQDGVSAAIRGAAAAEGAAAGGSEHIYEGVIRLRTTSSNGVRGVAGLLQQMAQWDQVRLLRLQGSENEPSVAVWLALAAPLPLAAMLQSLAGVRDVRETSPDAAPGAERELTITLNEAADGPAKS